MNALVDQSAANNAVMNSVDSDPFAVGAEDAGQVAFVKFKGASGQFLSGQDEDELQHGSKFVADIFNAKWIWQFWWEGKVIDSVEKYLRDDPLLYKNEPDFLPDDDDIDMTLEEIRKMQKEDPQNFRDGWSVQASFNMVAPENPDEEFAMRLGYGVSMNAFHALRKAFSRRYKLEAGKQPLIELTANKYKAKAKGVGWRFAPVMKIVGWLSPDDMISAAGEDDGDYDDIEPDETTMIEGPADDGHAPASETPKPRGRRGARGRKMA